MSGAGSKAAEGDSSDEFSSPPGAGRREPLHAPLFDAVARLSPDDFLVDERLDLALEGQGEHLWLHLEKRLLDTPHVLALLERVYALGSADIGVSGLKDRRAVTRQWFSVRSPLDEAPLIAALEASARAGGPAGGPAGGSAGGSADGPADGPADDMGAGGATLNLLAATRHTRKLRRGTHVANAFTITLRGVSPRTPEEAFEAALAERVASLLGQGYPNYIGPQRFGRDGRNVPRALAWFRQPKRRTSRLQRGLYLSAARSELFNRVCAARVAAGNWCELLPGEPVVLDGSRSFFLPDDTPPTADAPVRTGPTLAARLAAGDVHPSAPWWGRGEPLARGVCRAFEEAALAGDAALREGLARAGLAQERRALRVVPRSLSARWRPAAPPGDSARDEDPPRAGGELVVSFDLPPGTFATTLLAELGECRVASEREG